MFVKERRPPLALLTLDACISRLNQDHPKLDELRKKAAQLQKGYNGERKLDYYLKSLDDTFSILSDVTLNIFGKQFQIDSFIVTANAIYIIEVKSLDGSITFDTGLKQLIQQNGEKLIGRKYPITQSENNAFLLLRWLESKELAGLPIMYYIAISEQSTIIRVNGDEQSIRKAVSYVDEIPLRLIQLNTRLSKTRTENNGLKNRIVQSVLRNCEELKIDILKQFNLNLQDILPGVHCDACLKLSMKRTRFGWKCLNCNYYSRIAHRKALLHYALIFGKEITNKQCQHFLGISRSTAYSILRNTKGVNILAQRKKKWLLDIEKLK